MDRSTIVRNNPPLLDRPRLWTHVSATVHHASLPKVVLIVGLPGSGKTVASQHLLQRIQHPVLAVDMAQRQQQGWAALRPALAQLVQLQAGRLEQWATACMPKSLLVRSFSEQERVASEAGLRASDAFTRRRCQTVRVSSQGTTPR